MELDVKTLSGSDSGKVPVGFDLVDAEKGNQAVHDTVVAFMAAQRMGTAKTKTRGEVSGTGKKPWRQKGTGRARTGSRRTPIFTGGGVAHGPKGAAYKIKKINKKVRKLALAQTLSKKNSDKNLHILADVKKEIKKTKEFNKFLIKNKLANVLIISDTDSMKNINKSARNIKNVKLIKEEGTNIYDLFKYKNVIITSSSAKKIQQRVLNEKN